MINNYKPNFLNTTKNYPCYNNKKNNTFNSLLEVGCFLNNLKQIVKGIKMYKLLKW